MWGKTMVTKRPRPKITHGKTEKVKVGCGNVYITINRDEEGHLVELFTTLGKSGGCAMAQNEAVTRLISMAFKYDIDAKEIIHQLKGIRCPSPGLDDGNDILSCADAIAQVLEKWTGDDRQT